MCSTCNENGVQTLCPACRQLQPGEGFPLGADAGIGEVWDYTFNIFKNEWVMLGVIIILFMVVSALGGVLTNIVSQIVNAIMGLKVDPQRPFDNLSDFAISGAISQLLGMVVQIPVQGVALLGTYRVLMDVLHGKKADIGRMFSQLHLVPKYIVFQLIILATVTVPTLIYFALLGFAAWKVSGVTGELGSRTFEQLMRSPAPLVFGVGSLGFVAIAIIVMPLTVFGVPELLVGDCEPTEALKRAWAMGSGNRLRIFGYALVAGLVTFVGFLVCCVGFIPATALGYMILLSLFLVVRKGSGLPPIVNR
jgi:hypothetical protein